MALYVSPEHSLQDRKGQGIENLIRKADNILYRERLLGSWSRCDNVVETIRDALETKDFMTMERSDMLKAQAVSLAVAAARTDLDFTALELLVEFHDVGNIGVDDAALFKLGMLDDREMATVRKHAEIGWRIARSIPDLLGVSDLILKHHEWWDGSGYPLGLAGADIPLACRIWAVIDAYDVMTEGRPYRAAIGAKTALRELQRQAGVQFEPELVEAFSVMMAEKNALTTPLLPV
ncbi:MAG TPA: HD domain-containing phosphohydrolase [Patescibacteria group bacterium]|nr:HD domain-containing phosphohydrolase [Patescibacteria group bacterium]